MLRDFSRPSDSPIQAECPLVLPRLPALGWATFSGPKRSSLTGILNAPQIRFTTSGRAAIALALRALGIGPGARVLAPTYHCPTMIAPIVAAGAEPIFFPIDRTGAPCLSALSERDLRGVRAMVAAHYFGLPQPMAGLRSLCDELGIALIEDCAHSLFGESEGRPVGQWGDYAVASLTKFLPVVDGGCLIDANGFLKSRPLSSPSIGAQLKSFANAVETGARYGGFRGANRLLTSVFAATAKLRRRRLQVEPATLRSADTAKWLADFEPPSTFNKAASWWTRWIARHAHLDRIVALRRRNYLHLTHLVADIPGVRALQAALPEHAAPYVFPLYVEHPEAIYQDVRAAGIPVFRWDELWPTCPASRTDIGIDWATHVFQIGCHQDLDAEAIVRIADQLSKIVRRPGHVFSGRANLITPPPGQAPRRRVGSADAPSSSTARDTN